MPGWQLLVIACEDGLTQVHLRNHQRDKSVRADLLIDEVMFRFASRVLHSSGSVELFIQAEKLTVQSIDLLSRIEKTMEDARSFPSEATHPAAFMKAAEILVTPTRSFGRFQNGVKSAGGRLRSLLYPCPPSKVPTSLMRFLEQSSDPNREAEAIQAFSDATLAVKTLQMIQENELSRPGRIVYGTKTLRVYLPMMLNSLLEGISPQQNHETLKEYVEASQQLISHLQRCRRQLDLLGGDPCP